MNNLKEIYNSNDKKVAASEVMKALIIYISVAAIFVAIVATLTAVYRIFYLNVFVCAIPNIILTIVFAWFSVLFFAVFYPEKVALKNFYNSQENAQKTNVRAVYKCQTGEQTLNRLKYIGHKVQCANGEQELCILADKNVEFAVGKTYDFSVMGTKIIAYAEVDDV